MKLTLYRIGPAFSTFVFGVLLDDAKYPICVTLEPLFFGRAKIPPGEWECVHTIFRRGGYKTLEVLVPGHSRLLFHIGNTPNESEGCILVGTYFGNKSIGDSRSAYNRFINAVTGRDVTLEVVDLR